jgi:predicted amidohydrolase
MEKLKVGLALLTENVELDEVGSLLDDLDIDLVLFPEYFFHSDDLVDAQKLARTNRKWIVGGLTDEREDGKLFQTGIVINPRGRIVGEHKKTSITKYEQGLGQLRGESIETIKTAFGKVGLAVCYEIFYPEIARIYSLQGARIIFNPIGTGMWNEDQYLAWNATARTRAVENGTFVLGVSHFNDAIPIAFAYAPGGECLIQARDVNRIIPVTLDLDKYPAWDFSQRRPELYGDLTK